MSIIGSNILAGAAGSGVSGYEIEQSLRFNNGDSAHLHRTPSSAGSQTTFTLSVWVKSSVPSSGSEYFYATHNGSRWNGILRRSGNYDFGVDESGASAPKVVTNAKLRDPSAWYHLVMAYDTTQATSTDRVKIWINGELQSINTSAGSYPNLNHGSTFNRAAKHWIGALDDTASVYYTKDFYLAEYHLLDGTAVTNAEDFGEYDDNGVWRPIEYAGGNYGTVGYYLKFDPSATNGIGHDHSGNGNNWTASGFTTSGTGTDVMSDTPTTNWCTSNPLLNNSSTYSDGNLVVTSTTSSTHTTSTFAVSSGKWYWECTPNQANSWIGVAGTTGGGALVYDNPLGYAYGHTGNKGSKATGSTSYGGASYTGGDVIGVALNLDDGEITFYKNGVSQGVAFTGLSGLFSPASSRAGTLVSLTHTYNFGQRAFAYTPPTGFNALNTSNLPAPDIADGSDYFDTVLWTGNQTARTISMNSTFTPDFIWIKNRTSGYNHSLQDIVRGYGPSTKLNSNTTTQENAANTEPQAGYVDSVAAGSFDIDASATATWYHNNLNSNAYVGWCWDAGGSGSSNTDGSITSTVSANPTAGFSIVTYTGTGVNSTVGHGLGVQPSFYVVKPRSYANNWPCWHKDLTSDGYYIHLNYSLKQDLATAVWNGTGPSSTVFNIGTNTNVNQLDATFVAYVFAEVEGYSKISSWAGNGSTDGPFVHCGFRPAFLLLKNYRGGSETDWIIQDSTRSTYNVVDDIFRANTSQAEASGNSNYYVDFLSNGFKIRTSSAAWNESGSDYLFLAFAENPFGGSGVSPATAR